ncbi:CoA transferase [Corynebacterium sp. Marseille-P3884]|uniref:CaiB/BaiF CoA transferase family protein n=1 Tax=Corynebacterium sp. Marseille-P3884 TaxID=2495409 RepID=UPI001B327BD0|nr:CoA transferase [Corynebacterium sp. Marseille-P3884]MBP3948396.1 CoA transferase [Corynebacterium sp. Marseille-P3884]
MALQQPQAGPLKGIVVADFSRVLAGPYATMLLADLGATVIKVEGPNGDDTRGWVPPKRGDVGTYYLSINRNKNSIKLNLKDPDDLETAYAIIDRADVLIDNFRVGSLDKFGLDPETVTKRWPELIHAKITGFGSRAGAQLPGYDMLIQASSGFMSMTGSPDGPPQKAGCAFIDVLTGLHTTVGILASLLRRERFGGGGETIRTNLLSAALSSMVNMTSAAVASDAEMTRTGNDHPSIFPYGPFSAKDRELVICVGNNKQFATLVDGLGSPDLANDPRFATNEQRNVNREELRPILTELLAAKTADEWIDLFRAKGLPIAPILSVREAIDFADDLELEPVVEITTKDGTDRVPFVSNPLDMSSGGITYTKAAPGLDEDRDDVLEWIAQTPAK